MSIWYIQKLSITTDSLCKAKGKYVIQMNILLYINLLKLKTLCTTSFNIKKFCVLPTIPQCVLRRSQNKQRLFLYAALTYRLLKPKQRVFTARYEMGL